MAKDFFGTLSATFSKTARELSGRAEEVYETQRLKNKISGEQRQVEKAMADLGRIIYKRYREDVPVDDAQKALCEQIDQRMELIEKYKADISDLKIKSKRVCPSCGSPIEADAAFCSQCGAACPTQEPEDAAGDDVIDGTAEEVTEEENEETVQEAEDVKESVAGTEEEPEAAEEESEEAAGSAAESEEQEEKTEE